MTLYSIKYIVIFFIVLISVNEALGQSKLEKLACDFIRIQKGSDSPDTLIGQIHYFHDKLHLHVHHPVNQVSFVDGSEMKVYYPDSNRGFHMTSDTPFDLPIVNSLIASLEDDYGLAKIGFQVRSNTVSGDTLITHWEHAEGAGHGFFEVYYTDDVIVKARFEAPSASMETELKNYKTLDGYRLPTHIKTSHSSIQNSTNENLFFEEISIDPEIPDSIKNFAFPEDAAIEIRQF